MRVNTEKEVKETITDRGQSRWMRERGGGELSHKIKWRSSSLSLSPVSVTCLSPFHLGLSLSTTPTLRSAIGDELLGDLTSESR